MARTDAPSGPADRDALRAEEGALAAFFDAARAEPLPAPPPAFLAAVLADARAEAPTPASRPAPARRSVRSRRPGFLARIGARLAPVGGWPGAGALAASAVIGFWAGTAGLGADYATPALWPDVSAMERAAAGIGDFFDLTSLEG